MVSVTKHNTPALRFGEYSQPWVEMKNNRIFVPTDERGFAGLPVLSATQKDGFIPRSMLGKEISYNKDAEKTYKRVLPDDFAIHLRSFQGGFAHSKYEGITSPAYTTFRLRQASQHDGLFWKYFFTSPLFIQSLTKVTYGIRDGRSIGADEYFLEDSCFPPLPEEQRAIGELFSNLDVLIEQHRAKHANLQQTKTALLQRMFPRDGSDEPELRLDGFSGAWKTKPLKDLGSPYGGLTGKTKSDFGHGNAHYITYLDVFEHALITDMSRLGTIEIDARQNEVNTGDALFTVSSEVADEVGMSAVWLGKGRNIYLNSFCFGFRPTVALDSNFFAYVLRSPEFRKKMGLLAQGISRFNISKLKAMELDISIPAIEEQRAIGEVFSNLDALIAAESRYITQLTQAKTALLQRMFV